MPAMPALNDIIVVIEIEEDDDLEVLCRSVPYGKAQEMSEWIGEEGGVQKSNQYFVDHIIRSWNFTDGAGAEAPVSIELINSMPLWLLQELKSGWNEGLITTPKGSGKPGRNGK